MAFHNTKSALQFSPRRNLLSHTNHNIARRSLLLCGILLSGGTTILPRPVLGILFFSFAIAHLWIVNGPVKRVDFRISLWISLIAAIGVFRFSNHEATALATRLINFFAGLLLLQAYSGKDRGLLMKDLEWLTYPMVYQAIITVILAAVAAPLFFNLTIDDQNLSTAFLLFNYHATLEDGGNFVRPDGFFWEPGVLQLYLNIFLYISLFISRNTKRSILGLLGVAATQSTTGAVIAAILIGANFFARMRTAPVRRRRMVLVTGVILAIPVIFFVYQNLMDKLLGEGTGSFLVRQYDLLTAINIIAENPLIGIGFSKENYTDSARLLGFSDSPLGEAFFEERTGTSNGIAQLFYAIGIPLGFYALIGIIRQRHFPNKKIFSLMILIGLFGEALVFTPFISMIIFSGMYRESHFANPHRRKISTPAP